MAAVPGVRTWETRAMCSGRLPFLPTFFPSGLNPLDSAAHIQGGSLHSVLSHSALFSENASTEAVPEVCHFKQVDKTKTRQ